MKLPYIIILIPLLLIGCKSFDNATLEATPTNTLLAAQHESAQPVGDGTGDVIIPNPANPSEAIRTNLPPVIYDYTPKPQTASMVRGASELIPIPGARLFGEGLIAALGAYAGFRSRKYKRAAISGVEAANQFRKALNQRDPKAESEVKAEVKQRQKTDGTWSAINSIINQFLK